MECIPGSMKALSCNAVGGSQDDLGLRVQRGMGDVVAQGAQALEQGTGTVQGIQEAAVHTCSPAAMAAQALRRGRGIVKGTREPPVHTCSPAAMAAQASAVRRSMAQAPVTNLA